MADLRGLFMRIGRDRRVRNLAALLFLAWVVVPLTMGSRHLAQCECDFVRTWKVSNLAWSPMNGGVPPDAAPTLSTSVDNGRVLHQLRIGQTPGGLPYGSPATATWTPPEGSTSIDFDGNPPANPEGPPPYRFTVVVGGSVQVSYIKPVGDVTDTFTATTPAGTYGTTCVTKGASFTAEGSSSADLADTGAADPALHVAEAPASAAEPSGPAEAPAAVYYVWNSNLWVGDPGNALSTATCQEWVDLLQSDDTFFGVQFPVPGSTATSGVATIPISLRGADAPRLELLDYTRPSGQQTVLSLPLELAPERAGYLVRSLPAQPGRFWAALRGAASPRVLCPSGMNLAADQWEFKSTINFDYGGQAGACAGCVVELHGCYEGDGSTLPGAGGASVLRGLGLHQSEGITCIGPAPIRMFGGTLAPPYLLTGPGFGSARPGHQVSFRHEFEQVSGTPTATLSVTSSLGVPWVLYEDFNGAPDLSRPIVAPITVSDGRGVWVSAVIPAGLAGAEVVRVTATSGSAQTWNTDHLWIGPFTPPPAPTSTATPAPTSYSRWLPVASHANGANDSRWRTDLGALNPGTEAATAELRLYTPGNVKTTSVQVPAGGQVILTDVVNLFPHSGSAPLEVVSDRPLVVSSRTYNQVAAAAPCTPNGTLGQSYDAATPAAGLAAGQSAWLPQLVETAAYRSNIMLVNFGATAATATVELYDGASGQALTSYAVTLAAGERKQEDRVFFNRAGRSNLAAGYARVTASTGAGIVALASVVDNTTNDPTTIPMVKGSGLADIWLPVASHANGANDSRWRTDLGALNPGAEAATAELRLYTPGNVKTTSVQVPAGGQVILADVVNLFPHAGSAPLEVVSDRPLVVSSRTYNQVAAAAPCTPNGTLGQNYDAATPAAGLAAGQSAWLPQLVETAAYRSNIMLVNFGATAATATVELYDGASGQALTSYAVTLAAGERKQEDRVFFNRAGRSNLAAGYARVTASTGAGIVALASVVDNTTNDPTTIPMVQ